MAKKLRGILILLGLLLLIGGGFFGIFYHNKAVIKHIPTTQNQIYYCPMHPNYTSNKTGECPICGMTLVLKTEDRGQNIEDRKAGEVFISPEKQQLIGVKTDTVRFINLQKSIRAKGIVEYDESKIYHIHIKIEGFIEKLYVNYTGKMVNKGEAMFSIYSPELVSSQEEYLLALKSQSSLLIEASKKRLKLWDISDKEINDIEKTKEIKKTLTIYSPYSGFVIEKMAIEGMKVMPNDELYKIVDTSSVWVIADVYEQDIPFVKLGQSAQLSLPATVKKYQGKITYIYPYLDTEARVVKVRIELSNPGFLLKQGMFADIEIKEDFGNRLCVPETSIIDTGQRQVVILAKGDGYFMAQEVSVGIRSQDYYEALSGLKAKDEVVTNANFLIDSESSMKAALSSMEHKH